MADSPEQGIHRQAVPFGADESDQPTAINAPILAGNGTRVYILVREVLRKKLPGTLVATVVDRTISRTPERCP